MEPYLAITPLTRGHAQNLEFGRENPIWWWWGEGATDNGNRGENRIGRDVQKLGGVGIRRLLGGGGRIRSAQRWRREEHGDGDERVRPVRVRKEKNKNERKTKTNSNEN